MRGPIWETLNALILILAGVDLLMMMHPAAIRTIRDVTDDLINHRKAVKPTPVPWADMRI
jgi:acetyl-CoA decarbonylase/synthase, CODH/ACS complex subunit delta